MFPKIEFQIQNYIGQVENNANKDKVEQVRTKKDIAFVLSLKIFIKIN